MHETKLYSITENGAEVFKGSAAEVAEHFDLPNKDMVYYYHMTGYLLLRKYTIEYAGVRVTKNPKEKKKEEKKKEPTKHQQTLEWIRIALMKPPNYMTSYHTNGKEFVDELKAEGITFRAEKHPRDKGDYFLIRT